MYKTKEYDLKERFGAGEDRYGQPYVIKFYPIGWCPSRVAALAEDISTKFSKIDPNDDEAPNPVDQIKSILPILSEIVVSWNLEYIVKTLPAGADPDDETVEEIVETKPLPLPSRIMRMSQERRDALTMELPPEILMNLFYEAAKMESELPLEKLSKSVNGSDDLKTPQAESVVNDNVRMLTPVAQEVDLAAQAEAQLRAMDLELRQQAPTSISPTG